MPSKKVLRRLCKDYNLDREGKRDKDGVRVKDRKRCQRCGKEIYRKGVFCHRCQ